jgi:hypothetical protein
VLCQEWAIVEDMTLAEAKSEIHSLLNKLEYPARDH